MKSYQQDLVNLLLETKALAFGEFKLKSGRLSPYFFNTAMFNTGSVISRLGAIYAAHFHDQGFDKCQVIFGPSYKGIPLAVATAIGLHRDFGAECQVVFDRKEAKDHGEGGLLIGGPIKPGSNVMIVDDVVTAGTTLRALVPPLKALEGVTVRGVVVAMDRCEKGTGEKSARQEAEEEFSIVVSPIITIHQVLEYLSSPASGANQLNAEMQTAIAKYLATYAA